MKILLLGKFNDTEYLNGPDKFSKRLFNELDIPDHNVVFIEYFFKNLSKSNFFLRLWGKEIIKKEKIFRMGYIRIFFYLMISQPDIIHVTSIQRFIIIIFLYKYLLKGKIITTVHSVLKFELYSNTNVDKDFGLNKDLLLEKLLYSFSDKLIFVSSQLLELAKKYYKINERRISIIPNGVDAKFYDNKNYNDFEDIIKIIFYNGTNEHIDRGINFVIDTLNKIITNRTICIYIIGNIYDYPQINKNINVKYCNIMDTDELVKFLNDKHLFIKSVTFDSFPIMGIECMAAGKIVIVSDNVGIKFYIEDGFNGFVYDKNQSNELKELLEKIFNKEYDLKRISKNASEIIMKLNWNIIAQKYLDLYSKS